MNTRRRAAIVFFAIILCGAVLLPAVLAEAEPAPLPVQIPIRDASEPPSSLQTPAPYYPTATRSRRHRRKPAKRRHRTAIKRTRRNGQQSQPKSAQAPAPHGPQLEQRPETPTESIMPLEPLPAPAPAPAPQAAPATPLKAAPSAPASPASGQPAQAIFPPAPEPTGQQPAPAPTTPAKP